MSGAQIALGLALLAGMGASAYIVARSPRKPPVDQYRESPMFQPKGRGAALATAIFAAAFAAFLYFGTKL